MQFWNPIPKFTTRLKTLCQDGPKSSVLERQVKNIGNDTAKSVVVTLTIYDKDKRVVGTQFTYPHLRTLKPDHKSTFKMTSSVDNFKGMEYYVISIDWKKPDGSKGYVENAQIYKK